MSLSCTKIEYSAGRLNLRINIANEYKGGKPEIQTAIDKLGTILYMELAKFVGKEKLSIQSNRTIPFG